MIRVRWEGGLARRGFGVEPAKSVNDERDDVLLALLPPRRRREIDADGRRYGAGVHDGEPAERDDAEQELRRLARRRGIEAELGGDRGERLLAGRERRRDFLRQLPGAERGALDQGHEARPGGEKVEVLADRAGENLFVGPAAGERPLASRADGAADLVEAPLEHRAVELGLRAEEVARGAARHPRQGAHVPQAGGGIAALGEQLLGGVENGRAGPFRVAFAFGCDGHRPPREWTCLSFSKYKLRRATVKPCPDIPRHAS